MCAFFVDESQGKKQKKKKAKRGSDVRCLPDRPPQDFLCPVCPVSRRGSTVYCTSTDQLNLAFSLLSTHSLIISCCCGASLRHVRGREAERVQLGLVLPSPIGLSHGTAFQCVF